MSRNQFGFTRIDYRRQLFWNVRVAIGPIACWLFDGRVPPSVAGYDRCLQETRFIS